METKAQNKIVTDFLKNQNRQVVLQGYEAKVNSNHKFSYSEIDNIKKAISKLCTIALLASENYSNENEKNEASFFAIELLDFYAKLNFEAEMLFIDSLKEANNKKEIDDFLNSKISLLSSENGKYQISIFNLNNYQIEQLKTTISKICKFSLFGVLELELTNGEKEEIRGFVIDLLNFSYKLNFEVETEFLDAIVSTKKKMKSEIEKGQNAHFLPTAEKWNELGTVIDKESSTTELVAGLEKPQSLVFYSDRLAVDPSQNQTKKEVKKEEVKA